MDKTYLSVNEPIPFYNVCKIHQPTIKEILDYGKDKYNNLLIPYTVSLDMINIPDEEKQQLRAFDLFFVRASEDKMLLNHEGRSFIDILVESLLFYCKDEIKFIPQIGFKIGNNKGFLNRDNFDEFSDTILAINTKERPKQEKIPEFTSERQRDIWMKLQQGRKRKQEQDTLTLETIMNFVKFGGKSYISSKEIKEMSMWELINAYKSIIEMEQYYSNFKVMLAGGKDVDLTHWTQKLKI